ncbi:hypothetical protein [Companilactobacillus ginsenosidimutans]|uniref:Uncharacterized protein n=1 Tax=Companilactobacillus ginsenosidimutans TaxID=1007676 RepID=A0A0H4QZA6_9LACO|nr:hypothetical protein [Companilactobacillus ginsenosidimutans]AKP66810.1 hypothetical protein ABM34_03995 [Companilactobacillus ginsenosidimutans]
MKATTGVQRSGWIVWWIETVVYIIGSSIFIGLVNVISDSTFSMQDKAFSFVIWLLLTFFFALEQVLAFFMVKYIHRDNSYVYPIILIALGFVGPKLYLIPGIWGVLYTNHGKLQK